MKTLSWSLITGLLFVLSVSNSLAATCSTNWNNGFCMYGVSAKPVGATAAYVGANMVNVKGQRSGDGSKITLIWKETNQGITPAGEVVIAGYFYASPNDVVWGSEANPDIYVKVWYPASGTGKLSINYFHVGLFEAQIYSGAAGAGANYVTYEGEAGVGKIVVDTAGKRYLRHDFTWTKPATVGPLLSQGELLGVDNPLYSVSGCFRLVLQRDSNLVLFNKSNKVLWSTGTMGANASHLIFQGDGNLVLYTSAWVPVWHSQTNGKGATWAQLQDDGNFVIYVNKTTPVWSTGTGGAACQ